MVFNISLPGESGVVLLRDLIPIARRPHAAVIILINLVFRRLEELIRNNGAYAWFQKKFTSGEDLDRAIQRAIAFVGLLPKEDRHRLSSFSRQSDPPSTLLLAVEIAPSISSRWLNWNRRGACYIIELKGAPTRSTWV